MHLFKKKCEYCRRKIEKGKEITENVIIPGFIGTHPKTFCSIEHINNYKREVEEHLKKSKICGGCCK